MGHVKNTVVVDVKTGSAKLVWLRVGDDGSGGQGTY